MCLGLRSNHNRVFQLQLCSRVPFQRIEINDQRVLNSEYRVVVEILAVTREDLRRYRFVAVFRYLVKSTLALDEQGREKSAAYNDMNMGWSVWMSVK